MAELDFKDLVVLVTGAGSGLGKTYAKFYAARGAKVVVNDVSAKAAQAVVDEINKAGGKAAPAPGSVAEGEKIVKAAVDAFGTVHVLINNAGILRDKAFKNMSDEDWDLVTLVHLKGAYSCTRACWGLFRNQKVRMCVEMTSGDIVKLRLERSGAAEERIERAREEVLVRRVRGSSRLASESKGTAAEEKSGCAKERRAARAIHPPGIRPEPLSEMGMIGTLEHHMEGDTAICNAGTGGTGVESSLATRYAAAGSASYESERADAQFGRVINTASAAGLYGNMGQANYSAAKMGLVGFTRTLAREGAKYNIKTNVIVPLAASAMTETIMPPDMLKGLKPEFIAPLVGVLTAKNGPEVNGRIFELGGGFVSEVRYERNEGAIWKTDDSFTPSAVAAKWETLQSFDKPEYPLNSEDGDMMGWLSKSRKAKPSEQASPAIEFKGKTVIVTGAGAGLGRAYALMFAKLGANVVVNDVSQQGADSVVKEVEAAGGKAVAAVCSAEEGEQIVKAGLDAFGAVHVLVANAGILRDKSFMGMDEKMWDQVISVHLRGTYRCCKAVWPHFQKQKYGRIITTASPNGLYGTIGQANYSTAKAALMGLTRTLAIEGSRANIKVNCIAPRAGTAMTATVWPKDMLEAMKPEFIAPFVGYLAAEQIEDTGTVHEVFGGYAARLRWQRTYGAVFPNDKELKPESIIAKWKEITTFDDRATHPSSGAESLEQIMDNFNNVSATSSGSDGEASSDNFIDSEDTKEVKEAKSNLPEPTEFEYTERDVLLYNLGVGAKADELQWTYENSDGFQPLPTFGVIPQFGTSSAYDFSSFVPNFNPTKLLHGEQYLKLLKGPLPTSGTLTNHVRLREVLDKGKAAMVTVHVETRDKATGEALVESQSTVVLRGSGGFGGKKNGSDRGNATALNDPPKRKPDAVVEEKTTLEQAAIYRLSGDYNPLHIDPDFSGMGGFPKPILHGLCSFGVAGKHVLKTFGPYSDIKVRFAGTVIPGETLVTEMWKEGDKVIFVGKVKERDAVVLSSAAVTLVGKDVDKAKL